MSTNKTANYNLHSWVPGDDFLRSEFNENFSLIDAALGALAGDAPWQKKLRIVTGSYTGNRTVNNYPRTISLPFTPKAVLVVGRCSTYENFVGLYLPGVDSGFGEIVENGFVVSDRLNWAPGVDYDGAIGDELNPFRYIALYWED